MSVDIPQLSSNTDTFGVWIQRTNDILNVLRSSVVTASVSGDSTLGNATLVGTFTANNITTNGTLRTNLIDTKVGNTSPIEITGIVNITNPSQLSVQAKNSLGPRIRIANDNIAWHAGLRGGSGSGVNSEYIIAVEGGDFNFRFGSDGTFYANNISIMSSTGTTDGAVKGSRTISTSNGISGGGDLTADRTFSLSGNALSLHNLSANGIISKTASGTVITRTIVNGSGITITNGNGVSGNPTVAVDSTVVVTSGAQTIGGQKTFSAKTFIGDVGADHTVINNNRINGSPLTAADATLDINYDTDFDYFRDLVVYNGKNEIVSKFIGSNSSFLHGPSNNSQIEIKDNQINASPNHSGNANILLNYNTNTAEIRGVKIYDGMQNEIAIFYGASGNLSVYGDVIAHGNIRTISDVRMKNSIVPVENALEKVSQMNGVYFNYSKTGAKSVGVIAQEIEKVLPEVVIEDEDGIKTVAYGNIVGVLIEAIKQLKTELDELKNK